MAAESTSRMAGGRGVSSQHERMVVDLTTSHESDPESLGSSRPLPPGPPSSSSDTTSGASNTSKWTGPVSLSSLATLIARQGDERREELTFLARLMAYGFTRPTEPSNPAQRRALLNASSAAELLDVLTGQYAAHDYSQSLAELRAHLITAQSENAALTRRLDTLAIENADLGTRLKIAENQVTVLEANAKHSANHVASLRKVIALSEAKLAKALEIEKSKVDSTLAQARLHHQQVQDCIAEIKTLHQTILDKDAAYVTLQGVAAKHFEQLQESARLLNSTGDPALRHAQTVVKDQRAVILRQKRIIQRQGCLSLHDPHMAAAAGAGLDVPGLNPADLKLNARLCRLLGMRFSEVMDIPAGESRRVELTPSWTGRISHELGCDSHRFV
ncbi:hypothetical protein PI124_g19269 [Phytophthora idaei]|nr:hypothetical protein PI124_g19269 [Phytophthora idaei]